MTRTRPFNQPLKLVPVTQETESYCGPAVIQQLYTQVKRFFTQDQIVMAADAEARIEDHGTRPDQLALAVKRLTPDLQFWFKQHATFQDLAVLVHYYHWPVAVNWQGLFYDTLEEEQLKNPHGEHGHYSVVIDIDPARDEIMIADPYHEYSATPRLFSLSWFKSRWWDVDEVIDQRTGKSDMIKTKQLIFIITPKEAIFPAQLKMQLPAALNQLQS